jgi:hypothetical protein
MQFFAIPRLDSGYEGIHLVWSWPDTLPISIDGYDIQRLANKEQRWASHCEQIDRPIIDYLRRNAEYPAPLGPLRLRQDAKFSPITDATLFSNAADTGDHPPGFGDPKSAEIHQSLSATLVAAPVLAAVVDLRVDEFIQELSVPVERATVSATARFAFAIALRAGKSVAVGASSATSSVIQLIAPAIDTIIVYALSPQLIDICVFDRPPESDRMWANAEYIVKHLTLPIRECNPALTTQAQEFAEAKSRLLGSETLKSADFKRLTATLRGTCGTPSLGRSGERICLTRSDASQNYEEMPLVTQLGALSLHPKSRRVLGFGFADRRGLVPGQSYIYRLTGRFDASDLNDQIYDIHRIPAATVLPASFSIRDLALRFQTPVSVVLEPVPSASALHAASRRGIRIDTTGFDSSWLLPSLDAWSAIITFPTPLSNIVLEVGAGHGFLYAAGLPWSVAFTPTVPLPTGPRVELNFASPVQELRLAGKGILFAVRIPSGARGVTEQHAYAGPVTFAPQPFPSSPTILTSYNLQQPPVTLTGPIDESTPVPPRAPVGFKLNWLPATSTAIGAWPDDLDAGPPLDSLAYAIEHRRVQPPATNGPWESINADDNLTLGSRDMGAPDVRLVYGCDLDELFPAVRPPSGEAGFALHLSDVFGEEDPTTGIVRPQQPLGSYHQYQIRSVDAVGRISAVPTLSNIARLEKHVPPPLPVGPQPPPALDTNGHLTEPSGPRARAIVRHAPGLTAADITLLGASQNVILLEWGWRQEERDADSTAAEFRVYLTRPPDVINAVITSVTSASPNWKLTLTSDLPLIANELVGQWITGNQPFQITQNDAGTSPTMLVAMSLIDPARQPALGGVRLGRGLQPDHQRARGWDTRVMVYPLTASDNYQHVFRDVLNISEANPRDSVWVGVSAADAQSYVADERSTGANANRPGNESGIASCQVTARYRGRPVFSIPPPLGDVPELVTDEPTGRQVLADLDLNAWLGGALASGAPVALLRCSADQVLVRVSVIAGEVVLTHPDGSQQTIPFPNPGDHATVIASLTGTDPQRIANRYLLHIIATAADPLAFFERTKGELDVVGVVQDRLAPKPARFFYAVKAADSLGHISAGGGVLPLVVRVPSTAAAAKPARRSLATTNTTLTLTLAVSADWETTGVLMFTAVTPPGTQPSPQGAAELLRLPNRRDLYPLNGLRLMTSAGELLSPVVAKALSDVDVVVEADGTRVAALTIPATQGAWVTVWCCALTRDGFPSFLAGPFSTGVGS